MAKLIYAVPPIEMDRELFLDTLACMGADGLLTRTQERTLSMLSAHRLPAVVAIAQRTPKGATTVEIGDDMFMIGRSGHVLKSKHGDDSPQ